MFNYNHVTLVGKVSSNIKMESINKSFFLKIDRPYDGKTKESDFIPVILNDDLIKSGNYTLIHDTCIMVEGRLQIRECKDKWIMELIAESLRVL